MIKSMEDITPEAAQYDMIAEGVLCASNELDLNPEDGNLQLICGSNETAGWKVCATFLSGWPGVFASRGVFCVELRNEIAQILCSATEIQAKMGILIRAEQ